MDEQLDPQRLEPEEETSAVNEMESSPEPEEDSVAAGGTDAETDLVIAEAVAPSALARTDDHSVLKAVIEAAIYITDEPLTPEQIAIAVERPLPDVKLALEALVSEYATPDRGLSIREVAGGYKMSTKAEYHDSVRRFVKNLQAPLKLSLAALETLAVVAYKQPITAPEIMDVRGVQGTGVLKTLLDRKLIATAGRKNVLGKPIMYRTTREFLVQFGLSSLAELPTLKEFEELGRLAFSDSEDLAPAGALTAAVSEPRTHTEVDAAPAEPPKDVSEPKHPLDGDHPKGKELEGKQEQEAQQVNG